jgi:cell wall-associated NlpC family hydrolase
MTNRNLSSPILCAIVLSLVANPALLSQAEPGVSNSTYCAPAAQPAPAAATSGAAMASAAKHTSAYTAVAGDSWTSIAAKFKTTRKKLKGLNNLATSTVKPGQVLQVPSTKSGPADGSNHSTALAAKAKPHHAYAMAQPVQDFDIPASTFASCPVPIPSPDEDADSPAPVVAEKRAPIAKLVSPAEFAEEPAPENVAPAAPTPQVTDTVVAPSSSTKHFTKTVLSYSTSVGPADGSNSPPPFNPPAPRPASRSLSQILGFGAPSPTPANDWGNRFLQQARALGNQGLEYDEDWRPPGESHAWTMDCSNTARYIYKVTTGIQLPRTASDQYYYLHLQGKAWDVPQASNGWADCEFLRHNLKPGDLLFWENTYRPERQPPITHVMVFLGTNDKGQWIMAGSQTSRGGEHNRRNGGPDIYIFRPAQPCGGYTTWLGLVHHQGRFCAFGRPLEADPTKLAVAVND